MGKLDQAEIVCIDVAEAIPLPQVRNLLGPYLVLSLQLLMGKVGQAELVCIDEAAAFPLPLVKNLLGPYLVFMSSTVNG